MNDYNISNYEKYLIKNKKDTKSEDVYKRQPIRIVTTTSTNTRSTQNISNERFNYNSFGNLTEEKDLINKTITKSKFNESGQVTSESITNTETNKLTSVSNYDYDDLGNVKEESTVTDNIESSQTNKYDSMGRVIISTDCLLYTSRCV